MSTQSVPNDASAGDPDVVAEQLRIEQRHVDRVYDELAKAARRAALVETEGMSRGRTDRTGDVRDEEITGLFERDALVYRANRRRRELDRQHEGLVFGRLDLQPNDYADREVRYVGRLGVRDDDYEPLVIDWRAPAAAPFYQATPVDPQGVLRRRVLRCRGDQVVGAEDDLMVTQAPEDLVVLGEGALIAALGRSRDSRMRDIVATIQVHQDEAIRAPGRGVTEITGGPGTGKTVVALHRAAYLLYADRRRYEGGGILVAGPSPAYTAYIERVLPSLGEESVTLRALGDVVDASTASRVDSPVAAAIKGSLRIRRVLARASRDTLPGTPAVLRAMVSGHPVRLERRRLDRARAHVLRRHHRNASQEAMVAALAAEAWLTVRTDKHDESDQEEFISTFVDHRDVEAFIAQWWRPVDPREVVLWLADPDRVRRYGRGVLTPAECTELSVSMAITREQNTWSVADIALIDDVAARIGTMPEAHTERGFFEIEDLNDMEAQRAIRVAGSEGAAGGVSPTRERVGEDPLLYGRIERPGEYAHVLIDEAQDVSPMQWRMLGRRGRWASWTIVGDAAQASWVDATEAHVAREEAFGSQPRALFHMSTNYRNAREIFTYAARVISEYVPDADLPDAIRETGVEPVDRTVAVDGDSAAALVEAARESLAYLAEEVEGSIAIITPKRWVRHLTDLPEVCGLDDRAVTVDPLSTKGLEYDATLVIDPDEITAESPGGARVLYVVLTRAAHRMHVLRPVSRAQD